jgi:hypothetical protein
VEAAQAGGGATAAGQRWPGELHCAGGRGGRAREQRALEEEEGGGGVSRDLVAKYKNPRDLTVEQNSPLIQNSNEEVTKIKVVAFFKPYNIALEFKFKNPRYTALNFKI